MAQRKKRDGAESSATKLWLIRHAHAVEATPDAARPLSKRGRGQVRTLAHFLGTAGAFQPVAIWHSPLVRARQTAELLARRLASDVPLVQVAGLKPEDDVAVLARRLARLRESVAIVGHEPHLSALASLLVVGAATPPVFVMKKCAVLALEKVDGSWVVRWHVSPEVLT